jgi:hypothetical protein
MGCPTDFLTNSYRTRGPACDYLTGIHIAHGGCHIERREHSCDFTSHTGEGKQLTKLL